LVAVTTYYMIETHALLALFQTHTPFVPEWVWQTSFL
jgi:hypothetical protein